MEKPKPTQSLEQKQETPEDYVVATFPVDTDPDNARRPLTVIRSGQDGEGVKYDRGWNPIGMLVVCDTDSEEGIGPIKLLMEAYKLVGTDIKTEFVPLEDIQGLNEDYIKYLYGKTPKEMIEEAKQIWRQKHTASDWNSLSTAETGLDESDSPELNRFDKRVLELMRPLETDVDGMSFRDDYTSVKLKFEHLLDPNYVPSNNVEDAAVRNPKGVPVSENSFNAAKEAIDNLAMNPSLMQIINPERLLDSKALINNIRASHLTRCRLFEYLTSSLDRLAAVNPGALADRVLRNSEDNLKAPNYLGGDYYAGKMRSREYTVVLAIAMMDGSFNVDRQNKKQNGYSLQGRQREKWYV